MKRPTISLDKAEQMAKDMGFSVAEPNDPIYSEGYSITLSSHTQKQSPQKATVSLPIDTQSGSDSTTQSDNSSLNDLRRRKGFPVRQSP